MDCTLIHASIIYSSLHNCGRPQHCCVVMNGMSHNSLIATCSMISGIQILENHLQLSNFRVSFNFANIQHDSYICNINCDTHRRFLSSSFISEWRLTKKIMNLLIVDLKETHLNIHLHLFAFHTKHHHQFLKNKLDLSVPTHPPMHKFYLFSNKQKN